MRVRDGVIVDRWSSLVKPERPITAAAKHVHGIGDAEVAGAPRFGNVWPDFRSFCGGNVIVAHNGHTFDFPVLRRMAVALGFSFDLTRYDSLPLARDLSPASAKLLDLARHFGIPVARAHRALDDTMTLASVFLALRQLKLSRARKTALDSQLDYLGVALALSDNASLCAEARACRDIARPYALGRYSNCLDWYEREQGNDISAPSVDEVIERLGGAALMLRIRTDKSAEERYPAAMMRLRRLIADLPDLPLDAQLSTFLERAALSQWEGEEPERLRVNLLTMHSTKGLEFSRVYVVGVEDGQLLLGSPTTGPSAQEIEEARRLLYVGMTRTIDRLVLTQVVTRGGKGTGGQQFLEEMGLAEPAVASAIRSTPGDVDSAHP